MSIENKTSDTSAAPAELPERQYEKTGLYPEGGKPFRLYALLGWLLGIIVFIAASAAALDRILL
ncbi:MAG: hypothetical protein AAB211_07460 [Pseudomonadota bacterium]